MTTSADARPGPVGPNGVAVRFGVFGWPRVTYQVADTRHAEVIDLPRQP